MRAGEEGFILGYTQKLEGHQPQGKKVQLEVVQLGPLGRPINIKRRSSAKHEEMEEITRWRGAVKGPAQNNYPDPKLHTLRGMIKGKPLDKITTCDLTRAIRGSKPKTTPRCREAWDERIGLELPWASIGGEFARNVGTTRDTGSWFRNILHRALWLKAKGGARHACSACADQNERENWEHFWRCKTWKPTWQKFVDLANELEGEHHAGHTEACIYLGIDGTGEAFKGTLGLLHKLVWKFIIMEFTKASIEGTQIQHETIWKRAMRRLATRINAQGRRVQRRNLSTEGRGTRSKWEKLNKRMGPVAHLDPDSGEVI